jgi:hypothetical protein
VQLAAEASEAAANHENRRLRQEVNPGLTSLQGLSNPRLHLAAIIAPRCQRDQSRRASSTASQAVRPAARWCVVLERARDDFRRTEQESAALAHRLLARLVRLFFEFLVLGLIAVAELDMLWRRAGGALAVRPKR